MQAIMKQIVNDLNFIKSELYDIKQNMPDKDLFLNKDEAKLLKTSISNEKKKKLISSNKLRTEMVYEL